MTVADPTSTPTGAPPAAPPIQRQISLPLSKAVEIAWKSIRLRLGRSLLVTSSIVLALAFLVSIQANESILDGMRRWIASAEASPESAALRSREAALKQEIEPIRRRLRSAAQAAPAPAADATPFDAGRAFGADLPAIQRETGPLPATAGEVTNALTADPDLAAPFRDYLSKARALAATRDELAAPDRLAAALRGRGVAMTPKEIAGNRIQTRWVLGLALLVAFVGILNAMLMSVTERFREIGTMKCLGALDGFIIKLFLLESLFQGVVGTAVGVGLGLSLSVLYAAATYGGSAFHALPWGEVAAATGVSLLIGVGLTVLGAVYPAWQAARMHPIEAMRSEA